MIFSDLYKSPMTTLHKFRLSLPHGVPPPSDLDADLVSRDKAKQKEAVKKYLAERIRNDWEFTWPPTGASADDPSPSAPAEHCLLPQTAVSEAAGAEAEDDATRDPGEEADSESDAESVYSTISEDPMRFRPRAEWTSDLSDGDEPPPPTSPFRFDSPDAVGAAVHSSLETKRTRRWRAVRDEARWNPGLACFEARRNAWTGAKTVRVKPKPQSPVSPTSTRRLFWRHHRTQSSVSHGVPVSPGSPPTTTCPLQPTTTRTSTATTSESDSGKSTATPIDRTTSNDLTPPVLYPVQTIIPIAPPLLPPQNPMRASVQPSMYSSLYDKVVAHSLQPSCPINLADVVRACVVGWKRDGEWPPKPSYPAAPPPLHTPPAGLIAQRQRKAREQRGRNAAAAAAAAAGKAGPEPLSAARRLSLGFLTGLHSGHHDATNHNGAGKPPAAPESTDHRHRHNNQNDDNINHNVNPGKEKDHAGKKDGLHHERPNSPSDEAGPGASGKALFRRSLQKVLSLGQHGNSSPGPNGNVPTSPS